MRKVVDLAVGGMEHQRVHAALEAVEDADAAACHLGHDGEAVGVRLVEEPQHLAPQVGCGVGLAEVDAHRVTGARRHLAHPRPFAHRHLGVLGSELEHAVPGVGDGIGDAQQFALVGGGARHQLAVLGAVERRTRGGESEGTGTERVADDAGHAADVVVGCGLVGGTAVAHHVGAHRTVADLGSDVEGARHGGKDVEVLGKGLPTPGDPLGKCAAGDVLDPLHQLDEPVVSIGGGGSEPDPAVAHHHRGHAVPSRRRDVGIPCGLGVVVRMDVDESGREQQAVGVDDHPAAAGDRADVDDAVAVDCYVGMASSSTGAVDDECIAYDEVMGHGKRASSWRSPLEEIAESCSNVRVPARSVKRPPASSTTTITAARS